jgi:hypothetical protein
MEEEASEERLKLLQDVRVYPVGRVLRDTFDADNHDTLGSDVAGLMINLSRVPFEPGVDRGNRAAAPSPPTQKVSAPPKPVDRKGVFRRLGALLLGR